MGTNKDLPRLRRDANEIFTAALKAASPADALKENLKVIPKKHKRPVLRINGASFDLNRFKNIYVIGGGKAACPMAKALEDLIGGYITSGLVVTKYGHLSKLKEIKAVEAAHPVPDVKGLEGAREILRIAERAWPEDLIICLLSGGASALLPAPVEGITLSDKQAITNLLLKSGADIREINAIRKHLSMIKGGGLMRLASPANVLTLIISDVVGSDISSIASGPTAPDITTYKDCIDVLKKYGLSSKAPKAVVTHLKEGAAGEIEETPKPDDEAFRYAHNFIIADNLISLSAAKKKAVSLGFRTVILSSAITGPTHEAARFLTSVAKEVKVSGNPVKAPACILFGGETTLKVTGNGLGGRNQEFALASALELDGTEGIVFLSAGTDGTDGPTDAAGAFDDSTTILRAKKAGLDPAAYLKNNDSYHFFKSLKDLLKTGPTGTNVMDICVALIV